MDSSEIIKRACLDMDSDDEKAKSILEKEYPFQPINYQNREISELDTLKLFVRDGFIDRYFGTRMIFPPVLRILSHKFSDQFPYHPNWKMNSCHIAYWELVPTIDHVIPIARGGANLMENMVCTSMLHNSVKSNFSLEQVGWTLKPCGKFNEWDGMIHWYISYLDNNSDMRNIPYFKRKYNLATRVLESLTQ